MANNKDQDTMKNRIPRKLKKRLYNLKYASYIQSLENCRLKNWLNKNRLVIILDVESDKLDFVGL